MTEPTDERAALVNKLAATRRALINLDAPRCPKCDSDDYKVIDRQMGLRRGHFEECRTCGFTNIRIRLPT